MLVWVGFRYPYHLVVVAVVVPVVLEDSLLVVVVDQGLASSLHPLVVVKAVARAPAFAQRVVPTRVLLLAPVVRVVVLYHLVVVLVRVVVVGYRRGPVGSPSACPLSSGEVRP